MINFIVLHRSSFHHMEQIVKRVAFRVQFYSLAELAPGGQLGARRALDAFVSKENKKLGHMHLVIGHHHEIATSSIGLSVIMVPYSRCSRNNPTIESSQLMRMLEKDFARDVVLMENNYERKLAKNVCHLLLKTNDCTSKE